MTFYIFKNFSPDSERAYNNICRMASASGIEIASNYDESVDYIICIGGDGTLLSCIHKCGFPSCPIIGVNTGHLGFFQDLTEELIDKYFSDFSADNFIIQKFKPVEANIYTSKDTYRRIGINEILVRGPFTHVTQFSVSIGDTLVQEFSGDGLLISTPVGSTAYNYSLGGAIVSPDLDVLQLTPVAPMNTNAYRSFHSSLILPAGDTINIEGIRRSANGKFLISFDGRTHEFVGVSRIEIEQSSRVIQLMRLKNYDYWKKLKSKLI